MPNGTHFEPQRTSADYSWVIEFSLQSTSEIELARNGSKADCISSLHLTRRVVNNPG